MNKLLDKSLAVAIRLRRESVRQQRISEGQLKKPEEKKPSKNYVHIICAEKKKLKWS